MAAHPVLQGDQAMSLKWIIYETLLKIKKIHLDGFVFPFFFQLIIPMHLLSLNNKDLIATSYFS
jgi:hypothetical protein